jgi:NNP family nitrate/nitrite transporter-like MFS transporter
MTTTAPTDPAAVRQLVAATGGFVVCFACFGTVSAMMPTFKASLQLDAVDASTAVAVPVLLGSLGRIPLGMLSDRLGPRRVFLAVLAVSALAVLAMGWVASYAALIAVGFLVGIGLACFPIGVGLVSGWYPRARHGAALGIYGAGNVGQSLAAFGVPVVAGALGPSWGFWAVAALTTAWLVVFAVLARDPPRRAAPLSLAESLRPLRDGRTWALSMYYFLTFGGFVAMAIYLPMLLAGTYGLGLLDAGLRAAGFVVLATIMRPIGGSLADRVGGRAILRFVFPVTAVMAGILCIEGMVPLTIGALGMAATIGVGNGAVFKLVPEYFPDRVGAVTGVVGAAGGLGGFFPPLVLGTCRELTGSYVPGFVLLALFALACLLVLVRSEPGPTSLAGGAGRPVGGAPLPQGPG